MNASRGNAQVRADRRHGGGAGFTLIEMIGVLAVLAMLAAVVTPNLAWRIRRGSAEREERTLQVLAQGLVQAVRATQVIPGAGTWAEHIAAHAGLSLAEVRHVRPATASGPRVYLVHPGFSPSVSGGSGPLWTQGTGGAGLVTNARVMILSCSKPGLDLPVASGGATSVAAFERIWEWTLDAASPEPPPGWPASWAGQGEFLHVRRVNLATEFHRITFSNLQHPDEHPAIRIGGAAPVEMQAAAQDGWYLAGTRIQMLKASGVGGALDLGCTVVGPMNFLYENDRWRVP